MSLTVLAIAGYYCSIRTCHPLNGKFGLAEINTEQWQGCCLAKEATLTCVACSSDAQRGNADMCNNLI